MGRQDRKDETVINNSRLPVPHIDRSRKKKGWTKVGGNLEEKEKDKGMVQAFRKETGGDLKTTRLHSSCFTNSSKRARLVAAA